MTTAAHSGPEHQQLYRCALACLAEPASAAATQGAEANWLNALSDEPGRCSWLEWQRQPPAADAALHRLARHYALQPAECVAVALAAAVETDPMVGRVLNWLQAPSGATRPVIGLLLSLAAALELPDALALLTDGTARQIGLLQTDPDERRPLPEQALWVPLPIVLALCASAGRTTRLRHPAATLRSNWPGLRRLTVPDPVPESIRQAAERQAAVLSPEQPGALAIRSAHPQEALAGAALVAAAGGRQAVSIDGELPRGLAPWLWLNEAVPVLYADLAPGESRHLPAVAGLHGPLLLACGLEGSFELDGSPVDCWRLPRPEVQERVELWRAHLGLAEAETLGRQQRHSPGQIRQLAQAARQQARLDGAETGFNLDHVRQVIRRGVTSELGSLAELLPERVDDAALVLPQVLRDALDSLQQRCRQRETLVDHLGPAARARYRPGVRALFVGPSGTGKTLAAAWLATRLGLPLYRVDLAGLVSKYIGETEKNLAQLMSRAEHAQVVLLFDEADALFGKRTDVKDAHDRYANQQTNYLLQRIESFDGIALLTSNSRARFDAAFARRLDLVIEFPLPDALARRQLWEAHLGHAACCSPADLNRLATLADLPGGHVRNVVLAACIQAGLRGEAISYTDLAVALKAEYAKLGRSAPAGL